MILVIVRYIYYPITKNKDYLFTYDRDGNIYLYDRRGNIRYDSKATCRPNKPKNIRFKKINGQVDNPAQYNTISGVQVDFIKLKNSKLTKQMKGFFTKKNTEPKKILKEYRIDKTENYKTGNELGFCCSCTSNKNFPYDLNKYYEDYDNGKVIFKGFETMDRGILEHYKTK